jgi:hypothetical protein
MNELFVILILSWEHRAFLFVAVITNHVISSPNLPAMQFLLIEKPSLTGQALCTFNILQFKTLVLHEYQIHFKHTLAETDQNRSQKKDRSRL